DSETLRKRNPRLIYAGIHGWREDGPYSGRPAYDDIIQGLCGVASLMDQLTGEPRYAPTILCDKTSGVAAALPHQGRLCLHAGLYRCTVAEVLGRGRQVGDDEGPALRRHGGAQPQH